MVNFHIGILNLHVPTSKLPTIVLSYVPAIVLSHWYQVNYLVNQVVNNKSGSMKLPTIIIELSISGTKFSTKYRNIVKLSVTMPKLYTSSTKSASINVWMLCIFLVEFPTTVT
jgi:hypothetical protein